MRVQSTLFDAEFMRKLETLRLLARKAFRGQSQNDRTTLRRGIGLNGLDRVGAVSFADELGRPLPPQRGRQQIFALFRYFEALQCQGGTELNRVLSNYARQSGKGGLAIVLSDLLDANGYARGLDALAYGRFDVLVIHLVDETEVNPPFEGALRLHDIESVQQRRLTVNRRM